MLTRRLVFVLALLVWPNVAHAQTVTDERVWFNTTFQERGSSSDALRWTFETYIRSREGVSELDVYGVRPSVTYSITSRSTIGGGYAVVASFPTTGGTSVEHRVFGQYGWTSPAAGGTVSFRTRVEARMIEDNSGPLGRVRQQVRFTRPLRQSSRFAVVAYDEFFVHLNNTTRNARGVEQNRVFGGLGVSLTPALRVDGGYLNQYYPGHRGAQDRMNHVLSGTLVITF